MKIVMVHYHLGAGGVTRVIESASRALMGAGEAHVILVGGGEVCGNLPVRVVDGLGYLSDAGELTAVGLARRMRMVARDALGGPPDIWHFHNHSLGKNVLMAGVVALLAAENERIVLQIHDLAEDGRPANYRLISGCRDVYPFSKRIHYAFLNSRDMAIFRRAGLPEENASVLENSVEKAHSIKSERAVDALWFAPVRGIRRKNIGEMVFLSSLAPSGVRFAISRAPRDAAALAIHDRWRDFSRRQQCPIEFEVVDRIAPVSGVGNEFESWFGHASHILTTSVAEGFGLPFLEAAAHGKPLVGRNISYLAEDYARRGIQLGNLYDQLLVPLEWVDLFLLRGCFKTTLERNYRWFGRDLTKDIFDDTFDSLMLDGWLDFGNLPESLQQGVIERVADPVSRDVPVVRKSGVDMPVREWFAEVLANRKSSVTRGQLKPYAPKTYQKNLKVIYKRLVAAGVEPIRFVSKESVLSECLVPDAFQFLLSAMESETRAGLRWRAVIFDIYGTLLIAPAGGVKPDPVSDPILCEILKGQGYQPPASPSAALYEAVQRHHAASRVAFPEVDLRVLWREVLGLSDGENMDDIVRLIESVWHPAVLMPGAAEFVKWLSRFGVSLGVLSNAQCNTLESLGGVADLLAPELCLLSYQHGIAKPSPELFQMMVDRLEGRGIAPEETLLIGNDPLQDMVPAAAHGFQTALFVGHPDSRRAGQCVPDITFRRWSELVDG